MSGHTPGLWARTGLMIHTPSTPEMPSLKIAKVFDYGETDAVKSPEEAEANAYLMEAAPDLRILADLGEKLSEYTAAINWDGHRNTDEWFSGLRELIEQYQTAYRAAIVKAEGRP